jgi:hypothetical protein
MRRPASPKESYARLDVLSNVPVSTKMTALRALGYLTVGNIEARELERKELS